MIGIRELKQKHYGAARQDFSQSVRGPVTDLTATLLTGWAMYGEGNSRAAVDTMDKLSGPDWYSIFKDLHAGLILDLAGDKKEAGKRFDAPTRRTRRRCGRRKPTAVSCRAMAARTTR